MIGQQIFAFLLFIPVAAAVISAIGLAVMFVVLLVAARRQLTAFKAAPAYKLLARVLLFSLILAGLTVATEWETIAAKLDAQA